MPSAGSSRAIAIRAASSNCSYFSLSSSLLASSCARDPQVQVSHDGASYLSTTGHASGVLRDADIVAVALSSERPDPGWRHTTIDHPRGHQERWYSFSARARPSSSAGKGMAVSHRRRRHPPSTILAHQNPPHVPAPSCKRHRACERWSTVLEQYTRTAEHEKTRGRPHALCNTASDC